MKRIEIDWMMVFLVTILVSMIAVFAWAVISGENNNRADCVANGQTLNMAVEYRFIEGCQVNTPEFGWYSLDEYLRLRGIQAIRENR